jgi:hypothetical protein
LNSKLAFFMKRSQPQASNSSSSGNDDNRHEVGRPVHQCKAGNRLAMAGPGF